MVFENIDVFLNFFGSKLISLSNRLQNNIIKLTIMKQKLLLFILPMLLISTTLFAQTKVWNFSSGWPESDGFVGYAGCTDPAINCPVIIDNLTIVPHTSTGNMGEITADVIDFGDGFISAVRFETNGSSGSSTAPVRRYLKFSVTGDVDVKVWLKAQGTSGRDFLVSDGTNVVFTKNYATDPTVEDIVTANYVGGATDLYIHGSNGFNLYKIEVTGPGAAVLGINDASPVTTNIKSVGSRIYVSNVKTSTEVNIYSITGALVKSFKTNNDTEFSFESGLWIAQLKTNEGQKAVKLVTH